MANPEHLAILSRGVAEWNAWRAEANRTADLEDAKVAHADLAEANLCGANLVRANLSDAILCDADLRCASLQSAHLLGTQLRGANLEKANLSGAHLRGADLRGASLRQAVLTLVDLSDTNLKGADLQSARAGLTMFADCDLSEIRGLNGVEHVAPSTVGLNTIYKSHGKIPESFLRDCGVPESFITQMRALVNAEDGMQFYSCFISHSTKDAEFAMRLHGKMRDAHLRVWYAPEDIKGGEKLHEQLETAIRSYDKLLIVLSEASLQSTWVQDELRKAFREEYESESAGKKKRKLFPVRLCDYPTLEKWECRDSRSGIDLAEEVRQYFIPDFSRWKEHDQFEASFARLLKDLKADEPGR
jgi:hypothetical protein